MAAFSNMRHRHVIELLTYGMEGGVRVLAYDFAPHGSLHDIIHGRPATPCVSFAATPPSPKLTPFCRSPGAGKKGKALSEPGPVLEWIQRVKIAVGAAKGMEYLHEKCSPPVIHKDIKSSNVLIFDDFDAKVADFNLSNQSPDQASRLHSTRVLGTFGYHAPE